MLEKRYSRYQREEVWMQLVQLQKQLEIELVPNSVYGNTVQIQRAGKTYKAVILARSAHWYEWSLNCTDRFLHGIQCVITATHDSCIDRPVLALDTMHWYESGKMRADFGVLQPTLDEQGNLVPDLFDEKRKSEYGHNMLLGALMQRRPDALARLEKMKPSTRRRIEAEVRKLHKRRVGHPLSV